MSALNALPSSSLIMPRAEEFGRAEAVPASATSIATAPMNPNFMSKALSD